MNVLNLIGDWCSVALTILAFLTAFIKPVRKKIIGYFKSHNEDKETRNGIDRCLLRHNMKEIFDKYYDSRVIPQDDWEDFMSSYASYKKIKGNLFVDSMYAHMLKWKIIFRGTKPDVSYFETVQMLVDAGINIDGLVTKE